MPPPHNSTPPSDASSPTDNNVRKRVCKACDRCRLKKSKCDGASPCSRCRSDNAICVFGDRKKSHDKIYPKGYVEMLERQQAQLVAGLQEFYLRAQTGQSWVGGPLQEADNGRPLTHEILKRLGALTQDNSEDDMDTFEEDLQAMQQRLIERGAGHMQRQDSTSSGSGEPFSPYENMAPNGSTLFNDPFGTKQAPPTPQSPFSNISTPQPQLGNTPMYHGMSMAQNMGNLQQPHQQTWATQSPANFGENNMDFLRRFDASNNFDTSSLHFNRQMMAPTIASQCLTMPDWNEDDEFKAFLNPTMA
ncbi:MAG: hypothetical protein M1819_003079 [Sarea resinae]|nr:MAG: hypothetical protein M1819_003079 [Sarea resinae]